MSTEVYKGVPDQTPDRFPLDYLHYVVQPGDTLFIIAQRLGVTVEDILRATPAIADSDLIFPGQILRIPTVGFPDAPSEDYIGYVVQPGVLLDDIAEIFNITVDTILEFNPTVIFPGRIYTIPTRNIEPVPTFNFFEYVVRPGDSLFIIADRFGLGVTVDSLLAANPGIRHPNLIFVGQIVNVPTVAPPNTPRPIEYVVQPGDSLFSIAQRFETTLSALISFNPAIPDPQVIYPGQIVDIPL
ncbi:LysM repeat protein [Desulfitispora alkaliphila]|uniref:LysM peptidoglycan-binding domain-containing protein n=1 Tax=Desulfitispora alkaliphila TaxID=622674 RepID=UPI003D196DC8